MYGMINLALEQMVKQGFGADTWDKIKNKAGLDEVRFISMKSYDDKVSYDLVGAASEVLNIDANELLEKFGEYWILHTAKEGYGDMLKMAGDNLPDFLKNLNLMHMKVGSVMPELIPPSFEVQDLTDNSLILIYSSKRAGLAPMVVGLVKGLGLRFNTPCEVNLVKQDNDNSTYSFNVTW